MREVKPTQKPVPSSDIKDLFFNSGLLDIWATSLEPKYIDRFGNCHLTAAGMEWLFKQLVEQFKVDMNTAIVAAGYITIDSFQQGAQLPNNEITQRNHILRDEKTGEYYRWDGDLPKQVPAGSTPQSTGGIGKGAWVSVGDASVRTELKTENGVSLVGGAVYRINIVDRMKNIAFLPRDGDVCITSGYSHIFDGGGAEYAYSMSSTTVADGFLVHDCAHGGKWLLIDNRSRLPFQVAGAKVDGVTDDRAAFISVLKAKRPMSLLRGEMLISGHINLDDFNDQQWVGVDIEGVGLYSEIVFADGLGGFSTTDGFIRCLTLRNVRVKNKLMDKSGVGFQCPRGAEQILWENVTFSGWKVGYDVHAWNSSFANVTSRECEYSGCFSGTSLEINSLYALRCDNGHMLGFRYNKTTGDVGISPQALSYVKVGAMAADYCLVPYAFGFCQNVELASIGAEEYLGDCILDFSRIPTNRARQNIVIGSLDVYIESKHDKLISIVKEPNYKDGAYGSVTIKDTRIWSDRNIPFFDNSGTGFVTENILYNRALTKNEANGIKTETYTTVGEKNGLRLSLGTRIGSYSSMRNVKSILQVKAEGKLVIRIHEAAAGGLGSGVCCFGDIGIYPAHISGNNANRDCGAVKIATSADYAEGLSQLNSQKIGKLTNVTISSRVNNGVYEIVINLNQSVAYMLTLDVWKNGNFTSSFSDYYIE